MAYPPLSRFIRKQVFSFRIPKAISRFPPEIFFKLYLLKMLGTPSERAWKVLSWMCSHNFAEPSGKAPFGGAQNHVPVKVTTQFQKDPFQNGNQLNYKTEIWKAV